jgi:hypothetical protein
MWWLNYRRGGRVVGVVIVKSTRRGDHPLLHPRGPRSASFS